MNKEQKIIITILLSTIFLILLSVYVNADYEMVVGSGFCDVDSDCKLDNEFCVSEYTDDAYYEQANFLMQSKAAKNGFQGYCYTYYTVKPDMSVYYKDVVGTQVKCENKIIEVNNTIVEEVIKYVDRNVTVEKIINTSVVPKMYWYGYLAIILLTIYLTFIILIGKPWYHRDKRRTSFYDPLFSKKRLRIWAFRDKQKCIDEIEIVENDSIKQLQKSASFQSLHNSIIERELRKEEK